jgi:hypothetical protein
MAARTRAVTVACPLPRTMTDIPDYIEILGAEIRARDGALFEGREAAELRSKVDEAMHAALKFGLPDDANKEIERWRA